MEAMLVVLNTLHVLLFDYSAWLTAFGSVYQLVGVVAAFMIVGYLGAPLYIWSALLLIFCHGFFTNLTCFYGMFVVLFFINIPFVRRYVLSYPLMKMMGALKVLPKISETERVAIEAGTVWMDAELFSGKPNFNHMLAQNYAELTEEEQAFIDGPCEEVCKQVNDFQVHQRRDFSKDVWEKLKKGLFFGMIIPKEYGGLGFSPIANSAVVAKMSARSTPLGITVMVPNSLGPAELLIHYGTKVQKDHYLPRLADGREIPCFALTEPTAGSDAGAITANGVVFKGEDGKPWIRLNWKKRYITLAAISTVIGLAFKLRDPENLLKKGKDLGVNCALIPSKTPGVILGRRHDPLGVPFYNCPTEGHNVELLLEDVIIGGRDGVGQGWKMLMESLAAGRGISLPANSTGGAKLVTRVIGAYTAIRKQFGLAIGKFEGIEEPMAEIGGFTYMLDAARKYTCGALATGAKPAVVTAIAKYNFTEIFRKIINHGMDIQGGAAISLGPRNLLANPYFATPIGITVEGANILTRTLIVFGQGAIRCHPYVLDEIHALESENLKGFDHSFWGHVGHTIRNLFRVIVISITRGFFIIPPVFGYTSRYYQKLAWTSAKFALYADIAMALLGGNLKRKEKLTGRYADIFSWMYLGFSVLKRYEAEGRKKEDLPFVNWCMQYAFAQIQDSFQGIFQNIGWWAKPAAILNRINPIGKMPSDNLGSKVAQLIQKPGEQRDRLTAGIHLSKDPEDALGRLDRALKHITKSAPISKKIVQAIKEGDLKKDAPEHLIKNAVVAGVITVDESKLLLQSEKLRRDAIQVDDFSQIDYQKRTLNFPT